MMKKIGTAGSRLDNLSLFSAEAVGSNEDLIREIFLHLPVRSLIRFKLASKRWSSLISDPQFARDRTRRLNPNSIIPSGIFFYNFFNKSQEIESVSLGDCPIEHSRIRVPCLSFLNTAAGDGSKVTILQSCNGLLLCQFASELRDEYCVCNPTTKKYKILPQLILNPREYASGFTLAFDPTMSSHYKVISLVSDMDTRIEIYSSETGKWKIFACHINRYFMPPRKRTGFYWNSSIHWISPCIVVYCSFEYDLEKDNFEGCSLPPSPYCYKYESLRYFGESRGHLHLVYVLERCSKKLQVLERDRETLQWSEKYCVQICHLLSKFPEICVEVSNDYNVFASKVVYIFSVLSVYKGEKEEDSALVLAIPGKVISYNFHGKTSKVLCELPSQIVETPRLHCRNCYDYCTGFNFIESLASV